MTKFQKKFIATAKIPIKIEVSLKYFLTVIIKIPIPIDDIKIGVKK